METATVTANALGRYTAVARWSNQCWSIFVPEIGGVVADTPVLAEVEDVARAGIAARADLPADSVEVDVLGWATGDATTYTHPPHTEQVPLVGGADPKRLLLDTEGGPLLAWMPLNNAGTAELWLYVPLTVDEVEAIAAGEALSLERWLRVRYGADIVGYALQALICFESQYRQLWSVGVRDRERERAERPPADLYDRERLARALQVLRTPAAERRRLALGWAGEPATTPGQKAEAEAALRRAEEDAHRFYGELPPEGLTIDQTRRWVNDHRRAGG